MRFAILALSAFLIGVVSAWAGHSSITNMDVQAIMVARPLSSSGVELSVPFKALERSQNQTVLIQASGASPNYSVELLVTLDRNVFTAPGSVTFTKPEVGGNLYTFTDSLPHVFPLFGPACLGQQLRVTGLGGGAVQGNIDISELSQ